MIVTDEGCVWNSLKLEKMTVVLLKLTWCRKGANKSKRNMSNDFMVFAHFLPYLLGISHSLVTLSTQCCHPHPEFSYCNLTLLYSTLGGNFCSRWTRQMSSILLIKPFWIWEMFPGISWPKGESEGLDGSPTCCDLNPWLPFCAAGSLCKEWAGLEHLSDDFQPLT